MSWVCTNSALLRRGDYFLMFGRFTDWSRLLSFRHTCMNRQSCSSLRRNPTRRSYLVRLRATATRPRLIDVELAMVRQRSFVEWRTTWRPRLAHSVESKSSSLPFCRKFSSSKKRPTLRVAAPYFTQQVSRTPIDCQAISLPPPADLVSPSRRVSAPGRSLELRRCRGRLRRLRQ